MLQPTSSNAMNGYAESWSTKQKGIKLLKYKGQRKGKERGGTSERGTGALKKSKGENKVVDPVRNISVIKLAQVMG